MTAADDLICSLGLAAHPEGGWYRETWRSAGHAWVDRGGERVARSSATSIHFLLRRGERSHLHRIQSDELWIWQGGGVTHIYVLERDGVVRTIRLGPPGADGCVSQAVVEAGLWFASEPAPETEFALTACVVAPGFEFSEFEMADGGLLSAEYPELAVWIREYSIKPA